MKLSYFCLKFVRKFESDHLPFIELKSIIADRLPNAPKKP